nr:MBL fold metallo-hydrolase [Sphingomonas sp. EC-HK361]
MLKAIGKTLWIALILALLAIVIVPHFLDRRYYDGAPGPHYDGDRFFNPDGDSDTIRMPTGGSRAGFFWKYLTGNDGRPVWPDHVTVQPSKPERRVMGERMVATWIGHATVLVQTGGLNILTDPVWSRTAGPFGFGPARVAEPGVRLTDLPKIDLILVSHNHYDHMDLKTLRALWDRDHPMILTSLGNDSVIGAAAVKATALDWGDRIKVRPNIEVVVTRNHHWSSRWFTDRNRALWSSFIVHLPGGNIFFAGDTGMGDGQWITEAARLGPIRLALIPIGAFRFVPGQMGIGSHIGPVDAVEVYRRLGAAHAIPIHWGTFRLSYEAWDTPPKMLAAAMKCTGQTGFAPARIGQPVDVSAYAPPAPVKPLSRAARLACLDTPAVRALR